MEIRDKKQYLKELKKERSQLIKEKKELEQITIDKFLNPVIFNDRMAKKCDISARITAINNWIALLEAGQGL